MRFIPSLSSNFWIGKKEIKSNPFIWIAASGLRISLHHSLGCSNKKHLGIHNFQQIITQKDSAEQLKAGWVNAGKISHISCYFHLSSENTIFKKKQTNKTKASYYEPFWAWDAFWGLVGFVWAKHLAPVSTSTSFQQHGKIAQACSSQALMQN